MAALCRYSDGGQQVHLVHNAAGHFVVGRSCVALVRHPGTSVATTVISFSIIIFVITIITIVMSNCVYLSLLTIVVFPPKL